MKFSPFGLPASTVLVAFGLIVPWNRGAAADNALGQKAQEILKANCNRCHGPDSPGKGGMNFILDRDKLVARNKIVPGNAAESKLYQRDPQARNAARRA